MSWQPLITTVAHRPYVAGFLLAYLVIGILNRGLVRTLLFLIIGTTVAFLSEFCSIRWGLPYGMYHYLYENMPGELILGGVPVWDSVSYVFMAYASYEATSNIWGGWLGSGARRRRNAMSTGGRNPRQDPPPWLPAIFMTLLDVVTDPLAVRGDRWFLGKIFYYPHGGIYFGVPLSNFAGWFLVGFCIFVLFRIIEKKISSPTPLRIPLLGPLFYLSILLFNLAITFWIGEWGLGVAGLVILFSLFRKITIDINIRD